MMESKCPLCGNNIISLGYRPGVKCSVCAWFFAKPKPPAPPPRRKNDERTIFVIKDNEHD